MKVKGMAGVMLAGVMLAGGGEALADARNYTWTYEYMTMPEGAVEVEYYLTVKVPDTELSEVSTWQHQMELEYGITPRWDIAMYQVWEESQTEESSDFGYEGFKLRTRYRFSKAGKLPVDSLLYAEYERNSDLNESDVGEVKLVLAKTLGDFDVNYNQVFESELEYTSAGEHKYAAGVGCAVNTALHAGIESVGNYSEGEYAIGPTVGLKNKGKFLVFGVLAGLNEAAPDLQARLIVGAGL
jgi:hypothetical protein